jgi:cyclic pyranopterin phosphate synthase
VVEGGSGGDCDRCDRLRLSADGLLRPCLFSDVRFSIRELPFEEAIRRAVEAKPPSGTVSLENRMYHVGG